jgi:hypothetical protein
MNDTFQKLHERPSKSFTNLPRFPVATVAKKHSIAKRFLCNTEFVVLRNLLQIRQYFSMI